MKQEDKQYEKWLTELRNSQPVLNHPEELTSAILNEISRTAPPRKRRKYLIAAWVSGIAATFLLLLLINETRLTPSSFSQEEKPNVYTNWNNNKALPDNWEDMRLLEKSSYLSSRYIQHRQFRQKFIKENLIK